MKGKVLATRLTWYRPVASSLTKATMSGVGGLNKITKSTCCIHPHGGSYVCAIPIPLGQKKCSHNKKIWAPI